MLSIVSCFMASCTSSTDDVRQDVIFKNGTEDTLFIAASHYDDIDSVDFQLFPDYDMLANGSVYTDDVSLWSGINAQRECFVYPDSACLVDDYYLFNDKDTCYFFLVKLSDAKMFSWHEIRTCGLYQRCVVTKNRKGEFDRIIRYADTAEDKK